MPDVIDLISSSPRLPHPSSPSCPQVTSSSLPEGPLLGHNVKLINTSNKRNADCTRITGRLETNQLTDTSTLFDDIDDTIFDLLEEPRRKRSRLLTPNAENERFPEVPESESESLWKPPLLMSNNHQSTKGGALEPIEFTSSPEKTCPKRNKGGAAKEQKSPASRYTKPCSRANPLEQDDPLQSDPFASSPQRFVIGERPAAKRAASFDAFTSSPQPQASLWQNERHEYHPRLPDPARKSAVDVDHGNDSDPFADSPISELRPKAKHQNELIFIDDDSSEISSHSSDEGLPSIEDMDLSKRRARSPMRRTQSDMTWSNRKVQRSASVSKARPPRKTAAEREAEKESKRRERERLKASKAAEKHRVAALAEVNKLRTDKKVSTPEMMVDLPSGLTPTLRVQIQEMLQGLGVEHALWDCPEHSLILWRRKVTSRFNNDMGLWEPISPRINHEEIAVVLIVAEELVALIQDDQLMRRIADIKSLQANKKFVLILQGMNAWMRKNRTNRNRQFTSGVRNANRAPASTASSRARASAEYIPEDIIEDAMLSLHVEHGMLIHHTTAPIDTARWVTNFTQHISTIPYKKQRDQATSVAGFCMESGQVRTGDTMQDTYVRMLQEIVRITAPIAYGITAEFNSVTKLVQGLERGGPGRLDAVRKCTNKDGAVSDRTIGQAVSRRVHKVFTGTDEDSTDV